MGTRAKANLLGLLVVIAGAVLTAAPASGSGDDYCEADGAICIGTTCCIIGESCSTDPATCKEYCGAHPDAIGCGPHVM